MRWIGVVLVVTACGSSSAPPTVGPREARTVIQLAPVATDVEGAAVLDAAMHDAAVGAIAADGTYATDGAAPAYRLDLKVDAIDVSGAGPLELTCTVSVTISTAPERSIIGMATSNASVQTDAAGVDIARQDCVRAVIENLISVQIIPTLQKQ